MIKCDVQKKKIDSRLEYFLPCSIWAIALFRQGICNIAGFVKLMSFGPSNKGLCYIYGPIQTRKSEFSVPSQTA